MENRQTVSILQDKQLTMSSREIAELVNSRHDDVKRSIARLAERGVIIHPPLADEQFTDAMGRERTEQRYIFTGQQGKRDSIIIVAQLSPELTGRLVDRWLELEKAIATKATSLTEYDKAIIGNMIKNCAGLVIKEELQNLVPSLVEPIVKARLLEGNILIRHGKTAGEIWRENKLPRLKNAAVWLGNRLVEMGCAIEAQGRAEIGNRAIRLFDPDKSNICLRNGLLHTAKLYASERQGQGKLRLIKSNHEETKP